MRLGSYLTVLVLCLTASAAFSGVRADVDQIGPGSKLGTLTVGATTYTDVQIRSLNARTVTITHAGGMASIHLRDLSPAWQARFHYDTAAEAAAERRLRTPPSAPVPHPANHRTASPMEQLLRRFGEPAPLNPDVDLRAKFFQLELAVKNQGRRPSCAIFAVVSALEFQSAELTGKPQKFSEEYLSWATRKTVHRVPPPPADSATDADATTAAAAQDDADDGFSLGEVVNALRGYGIPLQASMPNTFGRAIGTIEEPPPAVVAEARAHQKVFVHLVPGRDNPTRLNNLIHALNAGVPVVIGLGWPNYRTLRTGYLSGQTPMVGRGHAVTLVGYVAKGERPEDVVFIFKNSWGVEWGQGGYGTVTYHYLRNYLGDAVLLEVQEG